MFVFFSIFSAPACFDIGIYLAIAQYYRLSIEWVNTALNMAMYCMGDTAKGECINEQLINDIQVTLPKIEDDVSLDFQFDSKLFVLKSQMHSCKKNNSHLYSFLYGACSYVLMIVHSIRFVQKPIK